jgi:hypothetical protein
MELIGSWPATARAERHKHRGVKRFRLYLRFTNKRLSLH